MLVLINNPEITDSHKYEQSKIKRLDCLKKYDLDEGFYGGNAKYIAVLEQEPLLLVINDEHKTLSVAVLEEDIKKLPTKYMQSLPVKYRAERRPLSRQAKTE